MNTSRPLRLLVVLVVAALMSACSIEDDAEPRAIDPSVVPFSLLATSTTTTTTEPARPKWVEIPTSIFLVDSDTEMLSEVVRMIPPPPSVRAGLQELLLGPTGEELARGLNSAIARSTELLGVDGPVDGVVTVNLSDNLRTISGQGQRLALAQVVFTATAAPDVTGVLFAFEGELSEVPNGQGVSSTQPLDRTDFATFDPSARVPPPEPALSPEPPPPPSPD